MIDNWTPLFRTKQRQTYPILVELRPRDQRLSMKDDIVPWLDANVKWSGKGKWSLEFDGPINLRNSFYRFHVASEEDAILIRLKYT